MAHCPPEGTKWLLRQRRNLNEAPDHALAWAGPNKPKENLVSFRIGQQLLSNFFI